MEPTYGKRYCACVRHSRRRLRLLCLFLIQVKLRNFTKSKELLWLQPAGHNPTIMCRLSSILMIHVFVYGTLKKGQPNYYRMFDRANGKAEYLASASTIQKFPLVIAGNYNIPFLLNIPGQGHRVHGEIYKVDDQMLTFLDDFESVPTMYQRTVVKLEVGQTAEGEETPSPGSITEAFVYSTTTYQPDWPSLPSYESYDAYGDHGLVYATREARD